MKSHTELLNALIDALYKAPLSKETHDIKMLAAETRGQMMATCDHCDTPPFTQPDYATPQPDADGWVENTGVIPKCEIKAIRFRGGDITNTADKVWAWDFLGTETDYHITHYKPL